MKMIWPGRALGVALVVPALLSLALFVSESVWPLVLVLDAAVAIVALVDLATLVGAGRLRVERHVGRVCSLDEPQDVELVDRKPGRRRRGRCGCATTFPTNSRPSRPHSTSQCRAGARPASPTEFVPKRRGTYVFEQVDALVASRLGFWRGQCSWPLRTEVRVYPDIHQVARFTMLARRDRLSLDGRAAVAPAGNRQRV